MKALAFCQMSIDRGMGKEDVVYRQWDVTQLLKEENLAICSNMDGPRDYHTD